MVQVTSSAFQYDWGFMGTIFVAVIAIIQNASVVWVVPASL